jgi:hypothetical protein
MSELGLRQVQALQVLAPSKGGEVLAGQVGDYQASIVRYQEEGKALMKKAKGFEEQYDALNYRDDQFDLSDAVLSLSLALLAVTALTSNRRLFAFSWLFGGFGAVIGFAGLAGINLHPDWLTRLLS